MLVRALVWVVVTAGCTDASVPEPPSLDARDIVEAARSAERVYGVPADLTLAVAYAETRWVLPDDRDHDHPPVLGLGGLRTWDARDPVGRAEALLGVDRETFAASETAGIVATAAVLYSLARDRHGEIPVRDGDWFEVLGDYSGAADPETRASYAFDVLRVLAEGLTERTRAGVLVSIAPRPVELPDVLGEARGYDGASYPGARFVPASTSNYGSRLGEPIRYVVIHTAEGSYTGTISWFQNRASRVSAHFVIRSSDGEVTQMLSEEASGWHAGNSLYNRQSIGIEHEGFMAAPDRWFTDAMYESSARLTRYLVDRYAIPIDREHIIGHVEVPGATHTDPGPGWNWDRYLELVRSMGTPPVTGPVYAAEYVAQSGPAEILAGERAVFSIDMRNTGTASWDLARTRLATSAPFDHASVFYDPDFWLAPGRACEPLEDGYAPGAVGRFAFMLKAPEVTEPTTVTDTFALYREGDASFGPDVPVSVIVRPRTASTTDDDRDGSSSLADCDDGDATAFPGATELCENGLDEDCDGADVSCGGGRRIPLSSPRSRGVTYGVDMSCSAPGGGSGVGFALLACAITLARTSRRRKHR